MNIMIYLNKSSLSQYTKAKTMSTSSWTIEFIHNSHFGQNINLCHKQKNLNIQLRI